MEEREGEGEGGGGGGLGGRKINGDDNGVVKVGSF